MSKVIAKQRVRSAAIALQLSLVNARSEAIRRNGNVTMTPVSSAWQSGWQITDSTGAVVQSQNALVGATIHHQRGQRRLPDLGTHLRRRPRRPSPSPPAGSICAYTVPRGHRRPPYVTKNHGVLSAMIPARKPQRGVSLIEVLVTMVIMAFGLLGLAALNSRIQLGEMESYQPPGAGVLERHGPAHELQHAADAAAEQHPFCLRHRHAAGDR